MTKTLGRYSDELLQGVTPDLANRRPPGLVDARNVITDDLALQPVPGQLPLLKKPDTKTILGMASLLQGGVPTLYFANRSDIYKWQSGPTPTLVTGGFTGTDDDLWSMETWGNFLVATNGVDAVKVDKNDGAGFVSLAGGWPLVKILLRYKAHLIGFNTSNDPREIIWSHDDNIELITPAASNTAGELFVRELDSGIVAALPLRDNIFFYSQNDAKLLRFVGSPFIFGQFPLLNDTGVVGPKAVVSDGNFHYGFSRKGIWQTDGSTVRYISTSVVWDFILADINLDKLHLVQAWHLPQFQLIAFFWPQAGRSSPTIGLGYKYSQPSWWPLGFGRSAVLGDSVFQDPLTGSSKGDIFRASITFEVPTELGEPVAAKGSLTLSQGYSDHPYSDFFYGGQVRY